MPLANLKKGRVLVSVLFFLAFYAIFTDFANLAPVWFINAATYLQFAPSVLQWIHLLSFASAGFIIVIVLTLLFGRVYCSTVCPLGTLQDLIIYIHRKINRKRRFRYLKPDRILRYGFLILTVAGVIIGTTLLVNLLDPYSLFGKVTVTLARPVVIGVNNLVSGILESMNRFLLKPVEIRGFVWPPFLFALLFLTGIVLLTVWKGRIYCNTVCPVGTLLGLISRISLFRISLDQMKCTRCGACLVTCKAGCIDVKNRNVDLSRCISCFNCLTACTENGVLYGRSRYGKTRLKREAAFPESSDLSKRSFLITLTAMAISPVAAAQLNAEKKGKGMRIGKGRHRHQGGGENTLPVTPPGSVGIEHFRDRCTACYLCVSACPTQVLQPTFLEYGWQGVFQPEMNYWVSFCNYDCVICTEVCPTGAILPLTFERKKEVQVGKARFIKEECIVTVKNTACGACSEHCPTKAVNMVPYKNGLTIPEVNQEICVGCGACEYACPTDPKSIVVDANAIHQKAKKPPEQKKEEKIDYKEEFPF